MNRKEYYIYQCTAKRNDGSIIERIFKFPSFWNYELIIAALHTTCDAPGLVTNITLINDGFEHIFRRYHLEINCGPAFCELENDEIKVILEYEDGIKTVFDCKKIGMEMAKNNITRKTPILVSIQGYNRFTQQEYYERETRIVLADSYLRGELMHVDFAKKDITRLFTLFVEDHFYE